MKTEDILEFKKAYRFSINTNGFHYARFRDSRNQVCYIGESSLADAAAIWFGLDDNLILIDDEQLEKLLPSFKAFINRDHVPRFSITVRYQVQCSFRIENDVLAFGPFQKEVYLSHDTVSNLIPLFEKVINGDSLA